VLIKARTEAGEERSTCMTVTPVCPVVPIMSFAAASPSWLLLQARITCAHPRELAGRFFPHAAVGAGDQGEAPGQVSLEWTVSRGVLPANSGYARMSPLGVR
jgi:hypothetical protein